MAKTLLLERVAGTDVSAAYDLDADLRSLMEASGPDAGRFSDTDSQGFGNYANGIGQALAVLALDRTPEGVPASAVEYLLRQQCSDGSFRLYQFGYVLSFDPFQTVDTHTCDDTAEGDPDTTAFALQALLAVPPTPGVGAGIDAAVAHLLAQQQPSGGFSAHGGPEQQHHRPGGHGPSGRRRDGRGRCRGRLPRDPAAPHLRRSRRPRLRPGCLYGRHRRRIGPSGPEPPPRAPSASASPATPASGWWPPSRPGWAPSPARRARLDRPPRPDPQLVTPASSPLSAPWSLGDR